MVDSTPLVCLKVFTRRVDQQVPGFIFDKNGCMFMQQVPTDKVEVFARLRRFNRQCKVLAAFRRAILAEVCVRAQF